MEASSSRSTVGAAPIHSLGADILCNIFALLNYFDLARCSAVCKPWSNIICTSAMMRNLYYKRNPHIRSNSKAAVPSETPMKVYLEELAMEQHRSALLGGSPVVYQWNGHSVRINSCRMKRGMILTGVGDKIVGLNGSQLCIWRRTEQRNVFQSREGIFSRGLCMRGLGMHFLWWLGRTHIPVMAQAPAMWAD